MMRHLVLLGCAAAGLLSCTSAPTNAQDANAVVAQNVAIAATGPLRARIETEFAAPTIEQTAKDAAQVRTIVGENIDPALLAGATAFAGQDYRFTPADGMARHAGTLTITYPDAATAAEKAKLAAGDKRFFRESKILIPMVAVQTGSDLVIFYTESAGDDRIRAMLAAAAKEVSGTAAR